ncbi:MAG: glycosyltransferase family 4 protein [Ferruginibacter sp.]
MKIVFAGRWSPLDKTAWSGIYYHTYQAIKRYADVQYFYYTWPWYLREWLIFQKQIQKLRSHKLAVEFLHDYARWFSRQLEKDLQRMKADIVFIPAAPQLIAYCKTDIPIVYLADATFQQLQGYYHSFSNLAAYNIRQGIELDKNAFNKAAHCIVASDWARLSAINDYKIPENKISMLPFGANLNAIPPVGDLKTECNEICNLLFLGVEWERKGGQTALDTFYTLQKRGFKATLTIIGCTPPFVVNDKNIKVIPFINKNVNEESALLYDIFRETDFLLLPTRAECSAVVYCEASAFGIPSITTNTGGIGNYVVDNFNGYMLPLSGKADDYTDKITELFSHPRSYMQFRQNARQRFEDLLNWDKWGQSFYKIAEQVLEGQPN